MPAGTPSCYRHPGRETHLRCTRCERYICPDCMVQASVGFQCPECVHSGNQNVRQARTTAGAILRPIGTPIVTYTLIAVNVVLFGLKELVGTNISPLGGTYSPVDVRFALVAKTFDFSNNPIGVANGQWYRLFTSMWLHASFIHIFMNMISLYFIGPMLEQLLGRWRYLSVYLITGLAGAATSYLFMSETSPYSIGASGAIAGVFGCLIVIGVRQKILNVQSIVVVLALNVYLTVQDSSIDWHAHLGGLVSGALIGAVFAFGPEIIKALGKASAPREQQFKTLATLQVATMVIVLAAAVGITAVHTSSLDDPANRVRSSSGS